MKEQEWSDYETFEKLVSEKQYSELCAQDQQLVNRFVANEQEYNALRTSELEMKHWFTENLVTGASDKSLVELKRELKRIHQPAMGYARWKVAAGYAMVAILFGVCGWWLGRSKEPVSVTAIQKVMVRDTVFVASKPDTVLRERIIYRDRPVILTTGSTSKETQKIVRGVSMKEKEDLDKLLVSGSE
ncbi:MAG TPA: hypothetical protein PLM56_08035 [Cyclobacteriaceae bacterium]|jgi:hypothetical protein|nr:hypothetical protein [Cytophagales bacterium]HNT49174.1 hypothetical protein [Cyclobacteriaceae bacterium]HRE67410.1 hypothetical protein [Cyclobacteriaceae bacterium]HRF33433.1 hypothetical protein [Cyclobacteriaceae bacterium]